ncbi:hypothetical protein AHF37_02809 [Paragonimus kellicotti]|nr:hypothetical protein AHF37_02809 [Paragonimus kellicotti]
MDTEEVETQPVEEPREKSLDSPSVILASPTQPMAVKSESHPSSSTEQSPVAASSEAEEVSAILKDEQYSKSSVGASHLVSPLSSLESQGHSGNTTEGDPNTGVDDSPHMRLSIRHSAGSEEEAATSIDGVRAAEVTPVFPRRRLSLLIPTETPLPQTELPATFNPSHKRKSLPLLCRKIPTNVVHNRVVLAKSEKTGNIPTDGKVTSTADRFLARVAAIKESPHSDQRTRPAPQDFCMTMWSYKEVKKVDVPMPELLEILLSGNAERISERLFKEIKCERDLAAELRVRSQME